MAGHLLILGPLQCLPTSCSPRSRGSAPPCGSWQLERCHPALCSPPVPSVKAREAKVRTSWWVYKSSPRFLLHPQPGEILPRHILGSCWGHCCFVCTTLSMLPACLPPTLPLGPPYQALLFPEVARTCPARTSLFLALLLSLLRDLRQGGSAHLFQRPLSPVSSKESWCFSVDKAIQAGSFKAPGTPVAAYGAVPWPWVSSQVFRLIASCLHDNILSASLLPPCPSQAIPRISIIIFFSSKSLSSRHQTRCIW